LIGILVSYWVGGGGAGPVGSSLVWCEIQRGAASSSSSTTNKRNMRSVGTDISCEEHTRCNSDSAQTTSTSTSSSTGRMRRYRFQMPQHRRHHLEDEEAKACAEKKDPSINAYASIVRLKSSSYIFRGKDKGRDLAMTKWKFQRQRPSAGQSDSSSSTSTVSTTISTVKHN
jgi:hypothetical protein